MLKVPDNIHWLLAFRTGQCSEAISIIEQYWDNFGKNWKAGWSASSTERDVYAKCGMFGTHNCLNSQFVDVFKSFNLQRWKSGESKLG